MLRQAPSVSWWAGSACTESLGSESGDVGCDAAEIDQFFPPPVPASRSGPPDAAGAHADVAELCEARAAEPGRLAATAAAAAPENRRRRGGCFPPPMPRASASLVLHAERRGGRLILTEVRADEVERRVVFRAERDGGRLRLRFANANDDDADPKRGSGGPEEGGGGGGSACAGGGGGGGGGDVVPVAVQHGGGGAVGVGGELCQVAAAVSRRGGVEVGTVVMGTI